MGRFDRRPKLRLLDARAGTLREVALEKSPDCPGCGDRPSSSAPAVISPVEVQAALGAANPPLLVDLRPAKQRSLCRLEGNRHLPFGELRARVGVLPKERNIVFYCHLGINSATATAWLAGQGYRVSSLAGGIEAWARELDPEMARY